MIPTSRILDGLIAAVLADLAASPSTLGAVATAHDVEFDAKRAAAHSSEYYHLVKGVRRSERHGFSMVFIAEPVGRDPWLFPGPIYREVYSVLVKLVWRDEPTTDGKLSETPDDRTDFLSEMAAALVNLLDAGVLATNGAWTLPSGDVVLNPYASDADEGDDETLRNELLSMAYIRFICFRTA